MCVNFVRLAIPAVVLALSIVTPSHANIGAENFDALPLSPMSDGHASDASPVPAPDRTLDAVMPLPGAFDLGETADQTAFGAAPHLTLPVSPTVPPAGFIGPSDMVASQSATALPARDYRSLGSRMGAAKWEALGIMAYTTAVQSILTNPNTDFHFSNEGWFGRDTANLGIDKLTHAFNAYIFSEFLGHRIARKTGDRSRAALPAALMGFGLQFYGELWDAHKTSSGFSIQDVTFNALGSTFSYFRHTVPGLEEKLDFRLMTLPNSKGFSRSGKKHYEQQHFLFAVKLAGFEKLESTPLRLLELHVGYRGKDFTNAERRAGIRPKRDIFFGLSVNVTELFFKNSRSRVGRAVASGLNYFQLPYISTHNYDGW